MEKTKKRKKMVPKATSSQNHNHTLGFPEFPLLFLCAGGRAFCPSHLTDPEDSSPSGHAATKIIFQHQIIVEKNSEAQLPWLWFVGWCFTHTEDPPSPPGQHRTQILTAPAPPVLLAPLSLPRSQLEVKGSTINFNFWVLNWENEYVHVALFSGTTGSALVLRGKPQLKPKELEELTVPHLENKILFLNTFYKCKLPPSAGAK